MYAAANFRDDSFVAQYLSPKVIRDMRLFSVHDDEKDFRLVISSIHDDRGYKKIIEVLSNQYNRERYAPDIQITDYDKHGDRSLTLTHFKRNGVALDELDAEDVSYNIHKLWGFPIHLISEDDDGFVDEIAQFD